MLRYLSSAQVILLPILVFVLLCPYSKVEESFNIQATHDILYLKQNLSLYDHLYFPGVVPRTFLGPLLIGAISSPLVYLASLLQASKFVVQYIVRICLGLSVGWCFIDFNNSIKFVFGKQIASRVAWITCSQFHFAFYASRSLPNTFALLFVLLSLSNLLRKRENQFIVYAGIAILLFRSELILFFGPCLLYGLAQRYIILRPFIFLTVMLTTLICVGLSTLVDTIFWNRFVWPEFEVFYFNTILNKSGQWGKMPFLWYFTSAIPRALSASTFILPLWAAIVMHNIYRGRILTDQSFPVSSLGLTLVGLVFVSVYSFLPHKELRFIIYAIPLFNLAVATVWIYFEKPLSMTGSRKKPKMNLVTILRKFVVSLCYLHLIFNVLSSSLFLMAAQYNYPGGEALTRLNQLEGLSKHKVHVHICNLAAQTGVTRFLEVHPNWIYNKTEAIESNLAELRNSSFTHLISEATNELVRLDSKNFHPLFEVDTFAGISFKWSLKLSELLGLRRQPSLVVYQRVGFGKR